VSVQSCGRKPMKAGIAFGESVCVSFSETMTMFIGLS
jgi:hypothetical protein